MAIEKMTFIDINGNSAYLDEVLIRCIRCGLFQPENAAKLSEYSIGSTALLRNPYGGLQIKMVEMASQLKITLSYSDEALQKPFHEDSDEFIEQTHEYLNRMRKEYPQYYERQNKIHDEIISYTTALEMLRHIDSPDINFDHLWENKFLKVRFGRLPTSNLSKLAVYDEKPYELYQLDSNLGYTWCLYVTASEYRDDIDAMFHTVGFERLRVPDYVHGTATDAISFIENGLEEERKHLEESSAEIEAFVVRERDTFLALYSKVKFLHSAYDLRKYAVCIRDHFHVIGFVLDSSSEAFVRMFDDLTQVVVTAAPANSEDTRIPPPVKLKNNWFVKPFEMFVNMYGSPSYNDIDPTPFVAYTYSILFGMMFGDMGHGFAVSLLGFFLWKFKKMQLGQIMSRIGVSAMVFGFGYGSIFGFEHLLDSFYINVLGLNEKPIEVMHPDTTNKILVAAIGIGAAVILMVIVFNMAIGFKHKDYDRAILSPNGLAGLVFYSAVIFAAVDEMIRHVDILSTGYTVCLIALPLLMMFFREPISRYVVFRAKSSIIYKEENLAETTTFHSGTINIPELFSSQFVSTRFGRIPTDSYRKLAFYANEPFMIYPIKSEREYIWCLYATAVTNKAEIDAIFHDLYFERVFIPDEDMRTNELAEAYIKKCVDAGGTPEEKIPDEKYGPVKIAHKKTAYQMMFPEGLGAFFTETFFEMFEVILSFITNTMSFLRVGGFILVHAGMMSVVFTLSGMVGAGASPVIIIIGNIFVMALEGLIVGIQVLRLEFYEIFSRFFDATGEVFKPVRVSEPPV